jgi:hypothetical protein
MGIDHLDKALSLFYNEKELRITDNYLAEEIFGTNADSDKGLALIKKLENDGYVFKHTSRFGESYSISFEGVLFFENTSRRYRGRPYKEGQNQQIRNQSWTNIKIIATVINAVIIISISYATCKVSDKTTQLEKENEQLKNKIIKVK